jgi:hypothetical protein
MERMKGYGGEEEAASEEERRPRQTGMKICLDLEENVTGGSGRIGKPPTKKTRALT